MSWISSTRRSLPKISLDDGGIVPDHVRRALGNDPPIIEHHYPIRDAHHHRHVVLDKQDGYAAVADVSDQLHEGVRFRGVHAGDRLVEQQHRRLGGQRQRHADQPLFTIGQRARKIVGAAFETNPFDQFAGAFPQTALRRPGARQPQYGFEKTEPALAMQPDQQIVVNAVVRKYAGALECADQTEISDLMRLQSIERRSTIAHGAMSYRGTALNGLKPHQIAELGLIRTFQRTSVFPNDSVYDNLLVGLHRQGRLSLFEAILGLPRARSSQRRLRERASELVEWVGLERRAHDLAGSLSYGEQRLVGVALALAAEPSMLLLDEPVSGMNASETHTFVQLVRNIRDRGVTILLVEHDMPMVMSVSDRIVVLNYGRIIAEGSPDVIRNDPAVIEAYLGQGATRA